MSNKKINLQTIANLTASNSFNYNLIDNEVSNYKNNQEQSSLAKTEVLNGLQVIPCLVFSELVRVNANPAQFEIISNTFEAKAKQGGAWYVERINDKNELVRDSKINKAISTAKAVYKHLFIDNKPLSYKQSPLDATQLKAVADIAIASNYDDLQGFADYSFSTLYDNIKKDEKAESEAIQAVQAQHGEKFNDLLALNPDAIFNEIATKKETILKTPQSKKPTIKEVVKPIDAMQVKHWLNNTNIDDVQAIFAEAQKILAASRHNLKIA